MTKGRSDFKAFGIIAFCDVTVISYRKRCFSVYLTINSFITAASQVLHSTEMIEIVARGERIFGLAEWE